MKNLMDISAMLKLKEKGMSNRAIAKTLGVDKKTVNKYVKPIADALIYSGVIKDDNITKMFYCVKGEYSKFPHTEIYVCDSAEIDNFFKKYISKQYRKFKDF